MTNIAIGSMQLIHLLPSMVGPEFFHFHKWPSFQNAVSQNVDFILPVAKDLLVHKHTLFIWI
jgi:hypothetical protein